MVDAKCLWCGETFSVRKLPAKYCSKSCKKNFYTHAEDRDSCSLDFCNRNATTKGLCYLHYQRTLRGTDLTIPIRSNAPRIDSKGYVKIGRKAEHRVVMAEKLGRELLPGENVHHINGNRSDNRPENLELWIRFQPPGQRVEDLLSWAYEIIERYGKEDNGC